MTPDFPSVLKLGSWTAVDWTNHLWQSSVVGVVLLALLELCGKLSARTRLGIGWLALGKFAVPVTAMVAAARFIAGAPARWLATESPVVSTGLPLTLSPTVTPATVASAPPFFPVAIPVSSSLASFAVQVWLAGLAVLGVIWLVRGVRVRRRLVAGAGAVAEPVRREIVATAALAGLKSVPRCVAVDAGPGPALVGLFSPVVILPRGLETSLSPEEFRAVLLHEFVHLRRRDHLVGTFRACYVGLLWFNPVVWLLNRRLRLEMEKACDERVVELTGDPDTYVSGIVKTVHHALGLHEAGLTGVTTPPIIGRINNVLARDSRRHDRRLQFLAFAVAMTIVACGGYTALLATARAADTPAPADAAPGKQSASVPPAPPGEAKALAAHQPLSLKITPGKGRPIPKYLYNEKTGAFEVSGFTNVETVSVNCADEDIRVIVRQVADMFELNVVMPDTLQGRTSVTLGDATWREIYKTILPPFNHTFIEEDSLVKIRAIPDPKSPQNHTLSVDFPDEQIRQIIYNVANLFELKVVMPDTLQGKTTIKLRDVTWRQIFQAVLEPAGYTFVEDGRVVRIIAKVAQRDDPSTTEVFLLNYVKAEEILPAISKLVADAAGKVVIDARSNSLVVTERSSRMSDIRSIIEQLDRVPDSQHVAPAVPSPAPAVVAPASPVAPVGPTAPALMASAATPQPPTQPESSLTPAALTKEVMAIPTGAPMPAPVAATGDVGRVEPPNPVGPTASDLKLRGIRVYDPGELDQQPVPKFQARPQFPLALRRSGVSGEATVDFIVDTNGEVQNAYAIHATYREFGLAAVAAVSQWKFRPGRKGGGVVNTHLQVPIVFTLNNR